MDDFDETMGVEEEEYNFDYNSARRFSVMRHILSEILDDYDNDYDTHPKRVINNNFAPMEMIIQKVTPTSSSQRLETNISLIKDKLMLFKCEEDEEEDVSEKSELVTDPWRMQSGNSTDNTYNISSGRNRFPSSSEDRQSFTRPVVGSEDKKSLTASTMVWDIPSNRTQIDNDRGDHTNRSGSDDDQTPSPLPKLDSISKMSSMTVFIVKQNKNFKKISDTDSGLSSDLHKNKHSFPETDSSTKSGSVTFRDAATQISDSDWTESEFRLVDNIRYECFNVSPVKSNVVVLNKCEEQEEVLTHCCKPKSFVSESLSDESTGCFSGCSKFWNRFRFDRHRNTNNNNIRA